MILIDFNNFCIIKHSGVVSLVLEEEKKEFKRTGLVNISEEKKREMQKSFLNFCVSEINYLSNKYKNYGNIIFANDYRKDLYWRKQIHLDYKKSRDIKKSNPFDDETNKIFSLSKKKFMNFLKETEIPFIEKLTTIYNNKEVSIEADEIIATISFSDPSKHLIVSNDGDYHQLLLLNNVKIYNPVHKKIIDKTKSEIKEKIKKDLLTGQSKDDIYPVTYNSHLSDDFLKWLKKEYQIELTDNIESIKLLTEKYTNYIDEYNKIQYDIQTREIEDGKRKSRRKKEAFKSPDLGEVKAIKIIESGIREFIQQNEFYKRNFVLNSQLYMLDSKTIPQVIQQRIKKEYSKFNNVSFNKSLFDKNCLMYGIKNI